MAQELLSFENFSILNALEIVRVDTLAAAGQMSVVLENAIFFTANDVIALDGGNENGEIAKIASVAGNTLTLTVNLLNTHQRGARVMKLRGDQVSLYRAANVDGTVPLDATFTPYAGTTPTNPANLQPDSAQTALIDPNGGQDYWYKAVPYNSVTATAVDLAFAEAMRGGDYGHYVTIDEIRLESGFGKNPYITDGQVYDARDSAEAEINGILGVSGYTLPFTNDVPILRVIAKQLASGYLLDADYGTGATGTSKDGISKKTEARTLLTAIRANQIVLVDANGIPLNEGNNPSGLPNDDTVSSLDDPRPPIFTMVDIF